MNREASLIYCHLCHTSLRMPGSLPAGHEIVCSRCGAVIHRRKPQSVSRTWALLVASLIFYIPANVLPMTHRTFIGGTKDDTILSGVIYFITDGSWHIALVIFVASIVVPLAKIVVLSFLLLSVHVGSAWHSQDRTRLYRVTRLIGRWSMIDLYVVAIATGLVQLGVFATIEAGPAAFFFGAVVILTMLSAETFDPRLIWDAQEEKHAV